MLNFDLSPQETETLLAAHRSTKSKRDAYRIHAICLLGNDWSYEEAANVLLLDKSTLQNYIKRYRTGGLDELLMDNYKGGGAAKLTQAQLLEFSEHLDGIIYQRIDDIVAYVKKQCHVEYTVSGMTDLLHRLNFVYKKPKAIPGKSDSIQQKDFIEKYKNLKENKGENDPILFMDGTHPQHNTMTAYGWIRSGVTKEIKTNSGRQRVNINGAIDIDSKRTVVDISGSVNAQSTIALFKRIEAIYPLAIVIHIICDNAKYYKSRLVQEYLIASRIQIIYLPPYSPNLNLIERLWKFYHKIILYNQYYETFDEFKEKTKKFFQYIRKYKKNLDSLLTENFETIGDK